MSITVGLTFEWLCMLLVCVLDSGVYTSQTSHSIHQSCKSGNCQLKGRIRFDVLPLSILLKYFLVFGSVHHLVCWLLFDLFNFGEVLNSVQLIFRGISLGGSQHIEK